MTGVDIITEALGLLGVTNPDSQLIANCVVPLDQMLSRWNTEGPAYFELIGNYRGRLGFPVGHIQAIVYNLAIALEPRFKAIQDLHLHQRANSAWLDLVAAEDSGNIDVTPAGKFRRPRMPTAFEKDLLAILAEAREELVSQLAAFRMAA
jgi:hypothetical protein